MQFKIVVRASKGSEGGGMPSGQPRTEMDRYNEELAKAGILPAAQNLHPSSKSLRMQFSGKRRTVTDGPFIETKELIGGS
jgi:hypothetical protein